MPGASAYEDSAIETMTASTNGYLLEASDVSKRYGAVVALKSASLRVRPGEAHALMGANGAGKSTLVKVLTGAVRPDEGTITVRGKERMAHSPAEARRGGLVSVYQEPALIPDLDISSNLRLTETPLEPFRDWVRQLGLGKLDLSRMARDLPLATLRIIDLARALAIRPDVLMLDEITAALPANLTESVLEVVASQRGGEGSIIFISHRMTEIASVCDRATVLREGVTVGVVDISADSADRIVELMLGEAVGEMPERTERPALASQQSEVPRLEVRSLGSSGRLRDVSFDVRAGEVVGSWLSRARARMSSSTSSPDQSTPARERSSSTGAPSLSGTRRMRSEPELSSCPPIGPKPCSCNARCGRTSHCPSVRRFPGGGRSGRSNEKPKVDKAIDTLQIDTRAQKEVRLLSGGNQQKVTIARWVAGGVETMLCFDPTRGIDIRTKHQVYLLLRDLAEAGAAILLYTSELSEIQLACDRAIVIFGGEVVAEIDASDADEATLLRAAHNLRSDAPLPEEVVAAAVAAEEDVESGGEEPAHSKPGEEPAEAGDL